MRISKSAVFHPRQVREMSEELKLGDKAGETIADREHRAAAIVHRKSMEQSGEPAPLDKPEASPQRQKSHSIDRWDDEGGAPAR